MTLEFPISSGVPRRPALLGVGAWISTVMGVLLLLFSFASAVGCADLTKLADTPLGDWAIPVIVGGDFINGFLLTAIGHGIRRKRPWVRQAALALWIVGGVFAIASAYAQHLNSVKFYFDLIWVFGLLGAWWYFFRKRNVVAYYASLEAHARG